MKRKVTSTDIARAAGVSQSTVSMILNKKYSVSFSKETIDKVEASAKELGYVPPKRTTRLGPKKERRVVGGWGRGRGGGVVHMPECKR